MWGVCVVGGENVPVNCRSSPNNDCVMSGRVRENLMVWVKRAFGSKCANYEPLLNRLGRGGLILVITQKGYFF